MVGMHGHGYQVGHMYSRRCQACMRWLDGGSEVAVGMASIQLG